MFVPDVMDIRVAENGRMVLPRAVREALGITGAGMIVLSWDGEEVRLSSMRKSIDHAQALYRAHAIDDQPSSAFLNDRRAEAGNEGDH